MRAAAQAGAIGLWFAAGSPAMAQEVRTDVSLGVTTAYDSNLLRSNRLRGNFDGSDERLTPAIDVDIARHIARNTFTLRGSAGYDFYRRNTELNRARVALDARAGLHPGAFCGVDLLAGVDVRQTDIAELGERVGNSSQEQHYGLDADCTHRAGLSPMVSATYTTIDNSRASRERYDLRSYDVLGGLAFSRPSIGTFEIIAGREGIMHPRRLLVTGATHDSTMVAQYGGGFRREVAPRLSGSIRVLWLKVRNRADIMNGFSGIGWTSTLRWTPWPRLAIQGALDRGVTGQSSFSSSYAVTTRETVTVTYTPGYRSGVGISIAKVNRDFRGENLTVDTIPRGADDTWALGGDWHFDPRRRLRILAGIDYRHRGSRNPLFDYSSVAVNVGLRVRP